MADYSGLAAAISVVSGQGHTDSGELGYEIDGFFRVVDPDNAKRFIVRFPNGNWVSALHRSKVQQKPGLPVLIGYDNIGRPYIVGEDPTKIDKFLAAGNPGTTVGLHDHVRNSALQYITDTWLLKQLRTKVDTGMTLEVVAGSYFANSALHWFDGSTISLDGYQPSSFASHRWVVIAINPNTETLVAVPGNVSTSIYPYDPVEIEPVAALAQGTGYVLLSAVWINNGETVLYNYQIEDLRFASGTMVGYLSDLLDVNSDYDYDGYVLTLDRGYWKAKPKITTTNLSLGDYPSPSELNAVFSTMASGFPVQNNDGGTGERYRLFIKQDSTWVMYNGIPLVGVPTLTYPGTDDIYTSDSTPTFTWVAA